MSLQNESLVIEGDGPEGLKNWYSKQGYYQAHGIQHKSVSFQRHVEYKEPYTDRIDKLPWTTYTLYPFPGCCGAAIFSGHWVDASKQKNGVGTKLHDEAILNLQRFGYSCSVCTLTSDMVAEIKILFRSGWKRVHTFKNKRTRNTVEIWVRDL